MASEQAIVNEALPKQWQKQLEQQIQAMTVATTVRPQSAQEPR